MRYKCIALIIIFTTLLSFKFPEDHTFHRDFGLEWVYFVGHLKAEDGQEFGYELSFFKLALRNEKESSRIEIFPVHFAISSVKKKMHKYHETRNRTLGKLAGYTKNGIYSGEYEFEILKEGKFRIKAQPKFASESLTLTLEPSNKPPLLHGDQGVSIKSRKHPELFSNYYSYPRLQSKGTLVFSNESYKIVSGDTWMDHEWSQKANENPSLASQATSWDWLSLSADDGSDFVSFNFRSAQSAESETSGILRKSTGEINRYENGNDIRMIAMEKSLWRSKHSGISYPLAWKITFPDGFWTVRAIFDEQEFDGRKSTGNIYWEGMVTAEGEINGKKRTARGYLELKGYGVSSKWWNL